MKTEKRQRKFIGTVVSEKMDKTLVIRVDHTVVHPKYGKRYVRSKKFYVHDEHNAHHIGDRVEFQACRPYSRTKHWRVFSHKATA